MAEQKQAAQVSSMAPLQYDIKGLLALSPEQQLELFGLNNQLENIISYLGRADKLTGKARDEVERQINEMLTPEISGSRIRWAVEDAERMVMTPKQRLDSNSPTSVLDD